MPYVYSMDHIICFTSSVSLLSAINIHFVAEQRASYLFGKSPKMCWRKIYVICLVQLFRQSCFNAPANTSYSFSLLRIISWSLQYCVKLRQYCVKLRQYCVFLRQYCVKLRCVFLRQYCCSTTGKPTRSFATERVSLDSV